MSTTTRSNRPTNPFEAVKSLVYNRNGPLTRELLLEPGRFGLGMTPARLKPDATTNIVCGFCATGCGLTAHLRDGEAVNLGPTANYPVNLGMACPKGWEALTVLDAPDRATTPLLRGKDGSLAPVDWHAALTTFCQRFKEIGNNYGPESVAFLSTGQIANEEMFLLGSLAKFGMRMLHGDGNTRQCMATAVTAYKQSFGFDAPPYTYRDFEESDLIILVGANLCIGHPIMWERVLRNPRNPQIVVVDPRTTETARAASMHLPIAPKSDLAFFYGLANVLIQRGWIDRDFVSAHTHGFDEFAGHVSTYSKELVARRTGVDASAIDRLAEMIHEAKRTSFWWTMGVNQSYEGVRTAQSLINLALMTGNIGRPGTGANSVTGQCNAMGSRLFSNTTNLLGGHSFECAEDREKVAEALSIRVDHIPSQPSWAYDQIIEGVLRGDIKGLWVIATNPAHSWIQQRRFRDVVDRLEFLVVQDMYRTTETASCADLVLPAAAWGEKDGTFINSERRIGLLKKVRRAPGQALADFEIFRLIASCWGCGELFAGWDSPEEVFQRMRAVTRGQPCDITGIEDYAMIDRLGGVQWPFPEGVSVERHENQRRLFADGRFFHDDQRARFIFGQPTPMPEPTDDQYPLLLLTGRGTASQWHTQTRTSKSDVLRKLYPEKVYVEINPADAKTYGVAPNCDVEVQSRRARVRANAFVTPAVQPGQVFLPMHYAAVNQLTLSHFDPYSRQPSYKNCAVRIRPCASVSP